ncbi:N utilization substance protein B [Thermaurantimonas aggregans]|uniref:N utilization substance protein B n=1 Tax=Thermaurantimonas aggregans TaxID=2173829 RepID=A0A401XLV6_9FLAO|nr:transcription antitermination protein NusB [Thermaurantimonas aggregans]MCX8149546.1 transcription antitermination protein NusB [Thermaurantimonas aggregans]GCD77978.1 N utilization substance protein B [Thermaurantimonas aggregans]
MLTRRQIRIKTFQALFAHHHAPIDIQVGLSNLFKSFEAIYDLFLFEVKGLLELRNTNLEIIERRKQKVKPTYEDLHPNLRFVNNKIFLHLVENKALQLLFEKRKIQWGDDRELIQRIYQNLIKAEEFQQYMNGTSSMNDFEFIVWVYSTAFANNELVHQLYEDKNIHWSEELEPAQMLVYQTLQNIWDDKQNILPELFKDESDREMAKNLYQKTIENDAYFESLIIKKIANWEPERVNVSDMILMKMALCEFMYFEEIPVKVTINEYLDLAKLYSTPKSRIFINGIIDKIAQELAEQNLLIKTGRGLLQE